MYVIICDKKRQPNETTEKKKRTKPELFRQSKKRDLTRWRWNIYICCSSEKKNERFIALECNGSDERVFIVSHIKKQQQPKEREKKNAKFYDRKPHKWLAWENLVHIR